MLSRIAIWLDDRLAFSRSGRKIINYIFPDHWSFLLGEIALYSFIFLVATGIFLTLYFVPSMHEVTYHAPLIVTGSGHIPSYLNGLRMSEAYKSTLELSFTVRAGLLVRQAHHWAALIFVGAICTHMARVFFTGAFRKPRELNWMVGATLLLLVLLNGYMGYSLPDDLMSGQGVRIGFSIVESIPFVGSYLAVWLFGANYPGTLLTERFFILHVLVVPLLIMGLLAVHLYMIIKPHHTQFPGTHEREDNVVGTPMFPAYSAKSIGLLCFVFGALLLLGAFVQIDPIWQYLPYQPFAPSDASQPDWYLGWVEGALRIFPAWEIHLPGHMVPEQFFPSVAMPGFSWLFFYSWPFLEQKVTRDRREHHLLDRPRNRPVRTGIGVGVLSFYLVCFIAGGDDVLASWFELSLNDVVWFLRIAALVAPPLLFLITWKICKELAPTPQRDSTLVLERGASGAIEPVATEGSRGFGEKKKIQSAAS